MKIQMTVNKAGEDTYTFECNPSDSAIQGIIDRMDRNITNHHGMAEYFMTLSLADGSFTKEYRSADATSTATLALVAD